MSIKQNGGVFGRNPTFNDVTIEGDLIINGEVFTGLDFQGSWNASTNTPALASSTGTNGEFYIVSVAGTTDLNGITNWGIGDWAIFNGTAWQRVEGGADGNFNDLTVAGSLSLGDNVKANFGAGDDLQIYYDGSHSWIKDAGAGNIYISSDGYAVNIVKGENAAAVASFIPDGPVNLYNAGDLRLATTATGIDVTGTATMDGLDVITESSPARIKVQRDDSSNSVDAASIDLLEGTGINADFGALGSFGYRLEVDGSTNNFNIKSGNGTNVETRLSIDRDLGDISFYDDSGNAKFYWDASAESLTVDQRIKVGSTADGIALQIDTGVGSILGVDTAGNGWNDLDIRAGSATQLYLDTSGNVGIGTSSPTNSITTTGALEFTGNAFNGSGTGIWSPLTNELGFVTAGSTRMRIDSVGNLLVGTTDTAPATNNVEGIVLRNEGHINVSRASGIVGYFNRKTNDGDIISLHKDGATVGSIGAIGGDIVIGTGACGIRFHDGTPAIQPINTNGNANNDAIDIGLAGNRFKDAYLSGGVYLGGTGTANKLDDYEEGTWTPALSFSGGSVGMTYSVQVGKYTKVGDMVTVSCQVTLSAKGSSTGIVKLTGLPFTASSDTNSWTPLSLQLGLVTFADFPQGYVRVGETAVSLNEITNSGYETTLGDTNFVDTSTVRISATYRV